MYIIRAESRPAGLLPKGERINGRGLAQRSTVG